MSSEAYSRALIPLASNERVVNRGFWHKVRRLAGSVPFLPEALAVYYAAMDPATPRRVRATLLAALAYFVVPADLIPDFIAVAGFTDDAAVLMMVIHTLSPHIHTRHYDRARRDLDALTGGTET